MNYDRLLVDEARPPLGKVSRRDKFRFLRAIFRRQGDPLQTVKPLAAAPKTAISKL
jgi:hypothetical protein